MHRLDSTSADLRSKHVVDCFQLKQMTTKSSLHGHPRLDACIVLDEPKYNVHDTFMHDMTISGRLGIINLVVIKHLLRIERAMPSFCRQSFSNVNR